MSHLDEAHKDSKSEKFLIAAAIIDENDFSSILVWSAGGLDEKSDEAQEHPACLHVTPLTDAIMSWMLALLIIFAFIYAFCMSGGDGEYGHTLWVARAVNVD